MAQAAAGGIRGRGLFLKSTATIVAVAFLSLSLQPLGFAADPQTAASSAQSSGADARLAHTLDTLESRLTRLDEKLNRREDVTAELTELTRLRLELDPLDATIAQDFEQIGQHLKAKSLPVIILDRHAQALAGYKQEMATLKANLDAINQVTSDTERTIKAKKAAEHLKAKQKKRPHSPFDPKSATPPKLSPRTPRSKPEQFSELQSPIRVAFTGNLAGLLINEATAALPSPSADDLAETAEVRFTPELTQIGQLLENDPVQLYEFVRNNFTYEPYYGSVKGSQSTLLLQSGNDFDQASVLIALFRQAGIPAHYVYGTVEIPIEKAMKWLGGIENPKVVGEALVSNGIPATVMVAAGAPKSVVLEHVWVEAYLPYDNYRGKILDPNGRKQWIPLDPSFKLHDPNPNALDLAVAQGFDADAFFDNTLRTLRPTTPAKEYLKNSIDYVANNLPGQRFYDLLSSGPIQEKVLGLLPNTLAYPVKALGGRFSSIPDALRHRIAIELGETSTIDLGPSLSFSTTWTSLLHKRVTLSYEPASAQDAETVAAYGNLYDTPPYLIYVKPVLKIEGQTAAEGAPVPMAADLAFRMTFTAANGEYQGTVNNTITAGAMHAIALDSGYTSGRIVTDRVTKWEAAVTAGETGEPIVGEFLNLFAVTYLQELDSARKLTARTMKLLDTNHQAEAMVGVDLVVGYAFGVPRSLTIGGVLIDVDRNISTNLSLDGDHSKTRRFVVLSGLTGSALEHSVFEAVLSEPTSPAEAISAVKALQLAATQGIPIHRIDQANIATILPGLQVDPRVISDIENAVAAGMSAVVSQTNVVLNQWQGAGYILLDPATGEGYYRISGGLSGGSLTNVITFMKDLVKSGTLRDDTARWLIREFRGLIWFSSPTEWAGFGIGTWGPRTRNGKREFHDGIDIALPVGHHVFAVAKGIVTVRSNPSGFGTYILIDHGLGVFTLYGHLQSVVDGINGTTVEGGQYIATSGNTGLETDGPHLHFSVYLTTGEYEGAYPLFKGMGGNYVFNYDASVDPQVHMKWQNIFF